MRLLIVESGFARGALAASRALTAAGWSVGIGSPTRKGLASSSRYCAFWDEVPPVEDNLERFLEATNHAVVRRGYEAVFCCSDAEALALSYGRDQVGAKIPYPPHDRVLRAFDKLDVLEAASDAGFAVPKTVVATEEELNKVSGPVIVKSRFHWLPGVTHAPARLEAELCAGEAEARQHASVMRAAGAEPLLQEPVWGPPIHYITVVDESGTRLGEAQTLSEPLFSPPIVGQRVRSKTVTVDDEIAGRVLKMLADLGWVGIASLMFLQPDGGSPHLVDFNGRFVASFDATLSSGPNFAAIAAAVATGRKPPIESNSAEGVRFQWLEGDLKRALKQRQGGLLRDLYGTISYAFGATHTVLRKDDLRPAMVLSRIMLRDVMRAAKKGKLRRGRGD